MEKVSDIKKNNFTHIAYSFDGNKEVFKRYIGSLEACSIIEGAFLKNSGSSCRIKIIQMFEEVLGYSTIKVSL